jgi:hypothetical protein
MKLGVFTVLLQNRPAEAAQEVRLMEEPATEEWAQL